MQRIVNATILNPFTGEPTKAAYTKKDAKGEDVPVVKDGAPLRDPYGNIVYEQELRDLTTAMAVRVMIERGFPLQNQDKESPLRPATLTEAGHALKILDALAPFKLSVLAFAEKQPKHIVFEQDTYDWLKSVFQARAVALWGITGKVYANAVENLEKFEEPTAKKARDNGEEADHPRLVKAK